MMPCMPNAVWGREGTTQTLFLLKLFFWWKMALTAAVSFPLCPSSSPVLPLRMYHPSASQFSCLCYPLYLSPLRNQCRIVWAMWRKRPWKQHHFEILSLCGLCWFFAVFWTWSQCRLGTTHSVTGCIFLLSCSYAVPLAQVSVTLQSTETSAFHQRRRKLSLARN